MLSYVENIPTILNAAKGYENVIDFGAGFGKYGMLLREQYLSEKAEKEIIPQDNMKIIAVEDTPFMLEKLNKNWAYDEVFNVSMFDFDFEKIKEKNTLCLLIDVVEHYEKEKIIDWVKKLQFDFLVSTPKNTVMYTQEFYGDPRHHKSQWEMSDFEKTGRQIINFSTNLSFIVKLI